MTIIPITIPDKQIAIRQPTKVVAIDNNGINNAPPTVKLVPTIAIAIAFFSTNHWLIVVISVGVIPTVLPKATTRL